MYKKPRQTEEELIFTNSFLSREPFFSIWGPDNLEYPVSLFQRNVEFLNDIIMGCQGLPGTRNIFFCIASKKSIGPLVPLRWPAFYYTSFLVVVAAANGSCNKTANTRANLGFRI